MYFVRVSNVDNVIGGVIDIRLNWFCWDHLYYQWLPCLPFGLKNTNWAGSSSVGLSHYSSLCNVISIFYNGILFSSCLKAMYQSGNQWTVLHRFSSWSWHYNCMNPVEVQGTACFCFLWHAHYHELAIFSMFFLLLFFPLSLFYIIFNYL